MFMWFQTSVPHPEFEGIYEANDDSHICPQREEFNQTLTGDLDCLRLNIFVPSTVSASEKRPVFVWIYGGLFSIGFYGRFMYGPKYLVRHDIIVVTINYRVGPYGFMCLDTPEIPGNQGLKDQILALKWLRENIEAFGGDPDKMTAGGNSAGSMSINLHLLEQNEDPKLIDKAILQSGSSYSLNYNRELNAPILISEYLGFLTDSVSVAVTFLATQDPHRVVEAGGALGLQFRPCVEKEFEGVEAYLLNNPFATSLVPSAKDMPIIIGFNNDESAATVYSGTNTNTVGAVLAGRFDISHEDFVGMEEVTEKFFYGDEIEGNLQPRIDLGSDTSFIYPSIRSLNKYIDSGAEKVYLYEFSYNGGRNFVQHRLNISGGGAWHADEISYLFDFSYMEEPTPEDQLIVDRITTMWANFVKTG